MKRKKLLSLVLSLAMAVSLAAPAMAAETDGGEVTILYTNDVHTYINEDLTYSKVAAYRDTLDNVLLVDAGDHIQGTAYGGLDNGETIIKLMNAAGYDAATLGNHEFDYGMDGCMNAIEWAQFPYVSCNFYHEKDGVAGESVLDSYKVFEVNGVKIAFVGITTPESFTKSTPAYFQDDKGNYIYGIAGGEDGSALYAAVQKAVDEASKEADVVIGLGHLGDDPSSQPWTSEEVIANTTGLDAFIDGHSHSTVPMKKVADKAGNTVVLTQTGSYLAALGQMTIAADGTITTKLLTAEDLADITPDADVKAIEDAWITEVDARLGQKIADTEIDFTINGADGKRAIRKTETNLGDFNADAYYWYLNEKEGLDCDFAIMNGGGIRANVAAGDWTYLTCKTVNTFGNVLCLVEVSGQDVLDALEFGARFTSGAECGGFLQVAGLTYEINTALPNTVKEDDKSVWQAGPDAYRVSNVQVYNKETGTYEPLDLSRTYTMAGTNYTLRNCGDGFDMFGETVLVKDYISEDYLALAAYAQAFADTDSDGYAELATANSPLASYEGYLLDYETSTGSGRITLVNHPADVKEGDWFYDAAMYVLDNGIMNGTGMGFEPQTSVTRAMVYQTLWNKEGCPAASSGSTFPDVEGKWYAVSAAWAQETGLTKGDSGLYAGDRAVTRAELATILTRYSVMEGTVSVIDDGSVESVPDYAAIPDWALDGMTFCYYAGLMTGDQTKVLNPTGTATRAELAAVVMRLDKLMETAQLS